MTKEQLKDLEGLLFRYYSAQVEANASGIEYDFDAKLPIIDFISKLNKEAKEEEKKRISTEYEYFNDGCGCCSSTYLAKELN